MDLAVDPVDLEFQVVLVPLASSDNHLGIARVIYL